MFSLIAPTYTPLRCSDFHGAILPIFARLLQLDACLPCPPGCEVHTFDPTLDAATQQRLSAMPGLHFHPWGLTGDPSNVGTPGGGGGGGVRGRRGLTVVRPAAMSASESAAAEGAAEAAAATLATGATAPENLEHVDDGGRRRLTVSVDRYDDKQPWDDKGGGGGEGGGLSWAGLEEEAAAVRRDQVCSYDHGTRLMEGDRTKTKNQRCPNGRTRTRLREHGCAWVRPHVYIY